MVTARDWAAPGGGGDKFRIKIWDKATGAIVYDNKRGQSDDSSAATAITQGNIVLDRGGND